MAQRQRTMRLIAIPLARARPGATPVSTFLAQRVTQKGKEKALGIEGSGAEDSKAAGQAGTEGDGQAKKEPLVSRLMTKASNFWISLGRTDVKSPLDWKRRTYTMGEKLMDRIEYEEWALKGVDPALGPSLDVEEAGRRRKDDREEKAKQQAVASASESSSSSSSKTPSVTSVGIGPPSPDNIPLLYPPSLLSPSPLLASLSRLTSSRQPHHRQRMIWCIIGMPFTIPFAIVPVVPNLPFFYLVWRAWSHWKAYSSSKYLSTIISRGRLIPTPSSQLDELFALPAPPAPPPGRTTDSEEANATGQGEKTAEQQRASQEVVPILHKANVEALIKTFELDAQLSVELNRALIQTESSIEKGQLQKLDEAAKEDNHRNEAK